MLAKVRAAEYRFPSLQIASGIVAARWSMATRPEYRRVGHRTPQEDTAKLRPGAEERDHAQDHAQDHDVTNAIA